MFGKKKPVRLDLKMEGGYYRLVVDYFDAKDKESIRAVLYAAMGKAYENHLLQADSNFINKKMDGKDGEWMEDLIHWSRTEGLAVDSFMFKREVSASVLGSLMGSKVTKPGYRVGVIVNEEHLPIAVKRHSEIDLGVHLGCGVREEVLDSILKDYCGGRIDEHNFEKYYEVDFYDYDMISRCVMKCLAAEPLEAVKRSLEERLA